MAVGHADFLPGYLQARHLKNTTLIFQMASVVVFSSPFLCWPDNPEAYLNSPLLHFVRTVPVAWDETRVLPGSRDRRHGDPGPAEGRRVVCGRAELPHGAAPSGTGLGDPGCRRSRMTTYCDNAEGNGCQIASGLKLPPDGKLTCVANRRRRTGPYLATQGISWLVVPQTRSMQAECITTRRCERASSGYQRHFPLGDFDRCHCAAVKAQEESPTRCRPRKYNSSHRHLRADDEFLLESDPPKYQFGGRRVADERHSRTLKILTHRYLPARNRGITIHDNGPVAQW